MINVFDWLRDNWTSIAIPLAVFLAFLIAMFWLRRQALIKLTNWLNNRSWEGKSILIEAINRPSTLWCFIVSVNVALAISVIPADWKSPIGNSIWTIFIASITMSLLNVTGSLIILFGPRLKLTRRAVLITRNITRIVILVIAVLTALDIWGVAITPLLLLLAIVVLIALVGFREAIPNFLAGFQINLSSIVKTGDYVKLETGEEGYIKDITWRSINLRSLNGVDIIIPSSRFTQSKVINYGRPLKKAKEPFQFYSRTHLAELTGLKASNIRELLEVLKTAPDSMVYYHTHHFLEEHHYLTQGPTSDFALWVNDALGDNILSERLASVDTMDFTSMGSLRIRLINIFEEYLSSGYEPRSVMPGREFYFMKSVSFILPTNYVAHDLREFVETLRKISLGALYFHVFESRLRLGKTLNDFTVWLKESLDDTELADEVARLDPYSYNLEALRSKLIQLCEKRIK